MEFTQLLNRCLQPESGNGDVITTIGVLVIIFLATTPNIVDKVKEDKDGKRRQSPAVKRSTSRLPPPSFLFVHGLIRLSHQFSKRDETPRIEVCDTEAERQHVTSFGRA